MINCKWTIKSSRTFLLARWRSGLSDRSSCGGRLLLGHRCYLSWRLLGRHSFSHRLERHSVVSTHCVNLETLRFYADNNGKSNSAIGGCGVGVPTPKSSLPVGRPGPLSNRMLLGTTRVSLSYMMWQTTYRWTDQLRSSSTRTWCTVPRTHNSYGDSFIRMEIGMNTLQKSY